MSVEGVYCLIATKHVVRAVIGKHHCRAKDETAVAFSSSSPERWRLEEELRHTPFALVLDAYGATLRVQKVASVTPSGHAVLGFMVHGIRGDPSRPRTVGVQAKRYQRLTERIASSG